MNKMRTIIATLLALVSLTMVSCTDGDDLLIDSIETVEYNNSTRANNKQGDAFVRFSMYSDINGYNVKVKNVRVENCLNPNNTPAIGTAFTDAEMLPTSEAAKIYDNADSKYNTVKTVQEESWIIVHFDVELSAAGNYDSKMTIKDAKYYISPKDADWAAGGYYDYTIKVDAQFLGLSEITFDASVEDFQNGENANVNI